MGRLTRRIVQAIWLVSCTVVLFGCRGLLPVKQGTQVYPEMRAGVRLPPPAPTDLAAVGSDGQWENLGAPMGSADALMPVADQRWEGVAVYFAYDRASIGSSERAKLEALADYLRRNPGYSVVVEGHCDERGSDEYNRGLGERRALAVKDYLVNLGVDVARLQTVSYGEERPQVLDAANESEHGRNRRAEFMIGVVR